MAGHTVVVSVLADTKKFSRQFKQLAKETGLDKLAGGAKKFGRALKSTVKGIGAVAAGIAALALKGGFTRAMDIEEAQAQLKGLGHGAKDIDRIMDSALDSVKGTSYGLGEAATVAAGAVAAGIEPGEGLTDTLKLTANAAANAKVDIDDMGSILNKVWTKNKATTQELNQLADKGIPIWTDLAEHYKVNADEMEKMVSRGEVDAETFAEVLTGTVGNSADEMGETVKGRWKNMMAALSRGGEAFLTGVWPLFKEGLGGITDLLDQIAPYAEAAGAAVAEWFQETALPALRKLGDWIQETGLPAVKALGDWIQETLWPALKNVADIITGSLTDAWNKITDAWRDGADAAKGTGQTLSDTLVKGLELAAGAIGAMVSAGGSVVAFITRWRAVLVPLAAVVATVTGAVMAVNRAIKIYQATMAIVRTVTTVVTGIKAGYAAASYGAAGATYAQNAAEKAGLVLFKAKSAALKVATGAQRAFNAVTRANPIGLIVTAIAALVAGLIYFFTQTETGQKIWEGFTEFLGDAWEWIKEAFAAGVEFVSEWLQKLWDFIKAVFAWHPLVIIIEHWEEIADAFKEGWEVVKGWLQKLWDFIKKVFKYSPLGLITSNWDKIKDAFKSGWETVKKWLQKAWDFIKKVWSYSPIGLITGNWGKITGAFSSGYNTVKSWLQKAWDFIKKVWSYNPFSLVKKNWNKITNFFKGIPGKIRSSMNSVKTGIKNAFKNAFNGVASFWNSTVGSFSFTVPDWVPGAGGKGWSFPNIPMLAAGGIVDRATLAMIGEAGPEAVIPLHKLEKMLGGGIGNARTTVYNINVKTGVGDPVQIGRDVKKYIKEYERQGGR